VHIFRKLAEIFSVMREFNLALWKNISPSDLGRVGQHNERGLESLELMLRMMAGHDLSHLAQIDRCIGATRLTC
jgi:hypothetical protein